jgi:uncharacterized protein (DUF1697 family)
MTTYVALLRAVNVGGRGTVSMAGLREVAAGLGFANPRTLLQSGNLVFEAAAANTARLESRLEAALASQCGVQTDVVLRSASGWEEVVARNPFPSEAAADPAHLVVMALKHAPAPSAEASLRAVIRGRETAAVVAAHVYLVYPDGIGNSRLTASVIEKAVGQRGTARNWNTVLKVQALLNPR